MDVKLLEAPVSDDTWDGPLPQLPAAEEIRLADIMQALSDINRLKMLQVLADDEWHSCSVETWGLDLQKSTISHHLKTLREAGLVEYQLRGRYKDARLRRAEVEQRFPGLLAGITSQQAADDVAT
jgi:DNA-binding transcriptional ArsR family regulator